MTAGNVAGEFVKQSAAHNGGFFVVGGPVQPDRECYAMRAADEQLQRYLDRSDHCHVLAPKQTGKTSLVARAARRLRREDRLVAVVDLTQIGSRDKQYAPRRWYYGLAYRIARDLRIKVDLQAWWRAKENLPNPERLVEFFWEIVLANTTAPIVVMFDDLETLVGLPYGSEFLNSLRACHDRRATEPDFLRLSFVLLGVATPDQLQPDPSAGIFQVSNGIVLDDFDFAAVSHFAGHLGGGEAENRRLLEHVLEWTGGQPYLTQKLCRSVARSRDKAPADEVVDAIAARLFLTTNCLRDEPHLNAIRVRLLEGGDKAEALLTLYGKLCKGARLTWDPDSALQQSLALSGLVTVGPRNRLQIRNKVYAEAFTARWVNQSLPFKWRVVALFAASVVFAVLLPLWYTQVLPRPYVETLSIASEDERIAMDAYESLRRIPGFERTANRLLAAFLERRLKSTDEFSVAQSSLQQLARLEGRDALAGGLLAAYWQRRAHAEESLQKRDDAIMFRLEALAAGDDTERSRLSALFGRDYPNLLGTIRPQGNLENAVLSDDGRVVTTLSDTNLVRRWRLSDSGPVAELGNALLAQEFVPVTRRLDIPQQGAIGGLELTVTVNHARPADLFFVLTGPRGKAVELDLSATSEAREIDYIFNTATYAFNGSTYPGLAAFAGDLREGVWTLTAEDQVTGVTGTLEAWGLQFTPNAVAVAKDTPDRGLLLPDPRSTENVRVVLGPAGSAAAATAINDLGRGQITTWDLERGRLLAQIPERTGSSVMSFAGRGQTLLVTATDTAATELWDSRSGKLLASSTSKGRFVVPPAIAADGAHYAVAAAQPDGGTIIDVFEIGVADPIGTVRTETQVVLLCLADGGRRLAAGARDNLIRVWDVGADTKAELFYETALTRMAFDSSGDWIVATARDGLLRAWDLRQGLSGNVESLRRLPHTQPEMLVRGPGPGQFLVWRSPMAAQLVDLDDLTAITPEMRHATSERAGSAPAVIAGVARSAPAILSAERNGIVRVWKIPADAATTSLGLERRPTAMSPDGKTFVLAAGPSLVFGNREADNGFVLSDPVQVHPVDVDFLRISEDGRWLVSADEDGSVRVWDLPGRTPTEVEFRNDLGPVNRIEINAEGDVLLTVNEYGGRVWNTVDGSALLDLGAVSAATAVSIDGEGEHIALQRPDGAVEVRALGDGAAVARFDVGGRLSALRFLPEGDAILAAGDDGTLTVWDWRAARQIGNPLPLGGRMLDGRFSPNRRGLLIRTDGWLHLVALSPSGPLTRVSLPHNSAFGGMPGFADRAGEKLVFAPLADNLVPAVLRIDGAGADGVEGPPDALRLAWQQRLGLIVGPDGSVELRQKTAGQ